MSNDKEQGAEPEFETDGVKGRMVINAANDIIDNDPTRFITRSFAVLENAGHSIRLINRADARYAISIPWDEISALREVLSHIAPEVVRSDLAQRPVVDPQRIAEIRERLAALCHEQWSGWMRYIFEKAQLLPRFRDPSTERELYVPRWQRQMETPYAELSEAEKESDRKEADKFLAALNSHLTCSIGSQRIKQLRERSVKAAKERAAFRFYENPTWDDIDYLLSCAQPAGAAHLKAIGEFLSEMAEIYSLDVVLDEPMKIKGVCAELIKQSKIAREALAQPAGELTVESCLQELREMFPRSFIRVRKVEAMRHDEHTGASEQEEQHAFIVVMGIGEANGRTLEDCMSQVRAWANA